MSGTWACFGRLNNLVQPARLRWIAGERVFVDCDVWQNPCEIEPHNACADDARRAVPSDHDIEH
jgi:hypothetical protein